MSILFPRGDETSGFDPIDVQLDRSRATARAVVGPLQGERFRWRTLPFPALLLLAGIAMGPQGLAVLNPSLIALLDPAAPVAIAVIGVSAGLMPGLGALGLLGGAAANSQAVLTGLLVATAALLVAPEAVGLPPFASWWIVAVVLGVAAATSSSPGSAAADTPSRSTTRLDADDYAVPIAGGAMVLAFVRTSSPEAALVLTLQTAVIAMAIGACGWLLLSRATEPTEQRVFGFASLLLLGGAADYLSASALLAGLVAGWCWRAVGGTVREHFLRDVAYVQHSLVALILLLAGAHTSFSRGAILLALLYLLVRTTGKLAGGWLASGLVSSLSDAAQLRLVSPGVFGVAFALNVVRAGGPEFTIALTAVVIGTIASSLIAAGTAGERVEW